MTAAEKKSLQRVTVYFKPDLLKRLKLLAVAQDQDASTLINEAMAEYLEKRKTLLQQLAQELTDSEK